MKFICYVNMRSDEYNEILEGKKTTLTEASNISRNLYMKVFNGDTIFLVNKRNGKTAIKATVENVINHSADRSGQSQEPVTLFMKDPNRNENKKNKYSKKKYLTIIEIKDIEKINPKMIGKANIGMVLKAKLN